MSHEVIPAVLQAFIGKYHDWSDQELAAAQAVSEIKTPLYHYTDGVGLKGIMESQTIWFTEYRHLNDPSELLHGIEMAHDVSRMLATGADELTRLFPAYRVKTYTH
jgi:hypothetical protein